MYKHMYKERYHLSYAKNTNLGLQTTENLGALGATMAAAADMLYISLRLLIVVSVFAFCAR